jgi:hypothetical protein
VKSGVVSFAIQARDSNRRMRITIASPSPMPRARPCCALGRFATRIGDEDDVVDSENHLEHEKRREGDPGLRV